MKNLKTRFFRHYKNKPYRYLGVAIHSETLEELVVYETLYPNDLGTLWVRPKTIFFEDIVVDGIKQPRFKKIEFTFKSFEKLTELPLADIEKIYKDSFKSDFNEEKFLAKLRKYQNFYVLIAYDQQAAVGMKIGYALNSNTFYSWLGGVISTFRGLGLASELMRLQHEWAGQHHYKKVETRTRSQFNSMIALNLAHGFKITGTQLDAESKIKINLEKLLS